MASARARATDRDEKEALLQRAKHLERLLDAGNERVALPDHAVAIEDEHVNILEPLRRILELGRRRNRRRPQRGARLLGAATRRSQRAMDARSGHERMRSAKSEQECSTAEHSFLPRGETDEQPRRPR